MPDPSGPGTHTPLIAFENIAGIDFILHISLSIAYSLKLIKGKLYVGNLEEFVIFATIGLI